MKRIVIGLSGASGMPIAERLLEVIRAIGEYEIHLVMTNGAIATIEQESKRSVADVEALADVVYPLTNIGASIASGTFQTEGMIICPCSMKTVAGIATGYSDNLLLRAADVVLKERKKLVVVARETPLSHIHLKNLTAISEAGGIILPPMQTYYNKPETLDDMIDHTVGKILDCFGIDYKNLKRWQ